MLIDWVLLAVWLAMTVALSAIATQFMLNRDRAKRQDEREQWMVRMVEERELTERAIERYEEAQRAWAVALQLSAQVDELKKASAVEDDA